MKEPQSHPNFNELESERVDWWYENGIVEQYLHRNDESDRRFSFLDGPITANNPMGVHHAHGRTIKDFFQRYKNMQGYKQRFQNGFDCQGLWVEVEEEKDLGFNSKKDIEDYGLDKFSVSCRNRVERFSQVQTEQSKRLGMFMDWENSYYTMSENNNLHIWYFLKKVDKKGWLYKGIDAMPWCTRCGTAISQHELSDDGGYKDVTHESVYAKFRLKNSDTYLLIWTTTPWTLPSNVAVAVDSDETYHELELDNGEHIIVINAPDNHQLTEVITPSTPIKVWKGSELVGLEYTTPFDDLPAVSAANDEFMQGKRSSFHQVISTKDLVDPNEGTGLIHIAPGAGKEDFDLGRELNLPVIESIDEFGNYLPGFGELSGKSVFETRDLIYKVLENDLFQKLEITHSYPHCWRCKHELVFRTTKEWFIRADEIRPLMKEAAAQANWMPQYAEKRMQDWLDNMGDWPISRKRYWGLALPFYESEDGSQYYVVSSKEELRQLALDPQKVDELPELHRPWIDEIELDGTKVMIDGQAQQGVWRRVKDVGDCWLDAGIVPFSTLNYLSNRENWQQWYPVELVTEYIAQVKLWFYATLFMSVTLEGKAPWENVLATGFLVDEKGDAMHKSRGNAIAFDEAAEKAGADSIRWLYLRERAANQHGTGNLRFGYTVLDEVRRRFLIILWNSYRFFVQNALLDKWEPTSDDTTNPPQSENVLDQWILSRLYQTLKISKTSIDAFDSTTAANAIESFVVNDLSQWYIRRSRDRVGPSSDASSSSREAFYQTNWHVFRTLVTMLSPFVPFISEEIYQNLRMGEDPVSVHLCDWPRRQDELIQTDLEEQMQVVRENVEKAHAERKKSESPLRQTLSQLSTTSYDELSPDLREVLAKEVNVLKVEPLTKVDSDEILVKLDFELTDELKDKWLLRELSRQIQNMRKKAQLALDDRINVFIESESALIQNLPHTEINQLATKLLADSIKFETGPGEFTESLNINGEHATIIIQKV